MEVVDLVCFSVEFRIARVRIGARGGPKLGKDPDPCTPCAGLGHDHPAADGCQALERHVGLGKRAARVALAGGLALHPPLPNRFRTSCAKWLWAGEPGLRAGKLPSDGGSRSEVLSSFGRQVNGVSSNLFVVRNPNLEFDVVGLKVCDITQAAVFQP